MGRSKIQSLEPKTPPPAAAPPAPPGGEMASLLGPAVPYPSYQEQDAVQPLRDTMQGTGSSYTPTISHYNQNAVYSSFGDANLRPNTGEANWVHGELLGMALHEILKTLQWSNIISCSLVIILEVMVAIFRIFALAKFVMGCYLAFFASLLLRVEIAQIIKQHRQQQKLEHENQSANGGGSADGWILNTGLRHASRIPDVQAPFLRDNFGLLFHPSGKASILLLMSSMCVGQHNNIFELVLGGVFGLNAIIILYLLCQYPSYRRQEDIPVPVLPPSPNSQRGAQVRQSATWSYYENDASSVWQVAATIAEGTSYLTSTGNSNNNKPS
ncbi:expressed unknown protein [Seminavis robusta]|uniref:Uncharacterized protein n=1 Tax=Seminavis robusta TaxID=568900 RepID=A0A9N8EGN3_9STRA|nr:expressed unknown protein [Seminavis robusta]|eukprot:Sro909_g218950.1 n/a (327) ;mRNA; f:14921-15901